MAATALIFRAPAMVAPNWIAKVYGAGIGGDTCNAAGNGSNCGAGSWIAGSRPYRGTARGANHGATGQTIAGISAATGEEQRRPPVRRERVWRA